MHALLLGLGSLGAYLYGVTARATLVTSPRTELPLVTRRCEECRTRKVVKNLVDEAVRGFKVSSATNHILTCHLPDPTRTPLRSSTLPACFKRAAASVGVGFSQRPLAVAVVTVSLKFSSMARWRPVRLPSNPPTPRPPFTATPPATPPCSQPFTRLDTSRLHHRSSRRAKEHGAPESRRAASLV